ncbi:CsiV family protein [Litoribrevibacter euphylliae]|uniref:CsiV family protein n=1 Tax=Litoribrevibacter euphylliae TaxID=1834034 RepID=A0ABV7HI16_9GAMM
MKSTILSAICIAICIASGSHVYAETTENDINAEDLSRDLEQQRQNIKAATSIPSAENSGQANSATTSEELPPWFKVEVIVFKQDIDKVTEEFPRAIDYKNPTPLIMLGGFDYSDRHPLQMENHGLEYTPLNNIPGIYNGTTTYQQQTQDLPESALRQENTTEPSLIPYQKEELELLKDAHKRLEKSQKYQVLLATAWKQPTLPKSESPTLHLIAGNWFDDQPEFEAFLKVSKQRYLHAYADLFLKTFSLKSDQAINLDLTDELFKDSINAEPTSNTTEVNSFDNQGIQPHHLKLFSLNVDEDVLGKKDEHTSSYVTNEVFHIKEDRIMKHSKDLYYLDHPKFGMIIKVTPLDKLKSSS